MVKSFWLKIISLVLMLAVSAAAQAELEIVTKTTVVEELRPLVNVKETKRPLLINFWATWCGPCRYEFPEFVKIDADFREKGLDTIIVSLDNIGAADSIVADFLLSYKSTMPSYLLDTPNPNTVYREIRRISPRSRGGLPLTILFDKRGRVVYEKPGVIDPKVLRSRIEKLFPAVKSPKSTP